MRVVGWYRRDAGYIDNIPGTIVFPINQVDFNGDIVNLPGDDIVFNNDAFVEEDYNDVDTYGARAALRIELDENWTVTPQIMAQRQLSRGTFGQERGLAPLQVQQFNPERTNDRWYQAALTIQGQIGNFDLTYAGAYMQRQIDGSTDYVDYAYFYDALYAYARFFYDNAGNQVNPNQYIISDDSLHPVDPGASLHLARRPAGEARRRPFLPAPDRTASSRTTSSTISPDSITITGTESNIWLTQQLRVDRDYAAYGEIALGHHPAADADRRRPALPLRQYARGLLRLQRRIQRKYRRIAMFRRQRWSTNRPAPTSTNGPPALVSSIESTRPTGSPTTIWSMRPGHAASGPAASIAAARCRPMAPTSSTITSWASRRAGSTTG